MIDQNMNDQNTVDIRLDLLLYGKYISKMNILTQMLM